MAAIEVRNLSFTYPTGQRKALDDISFDVDSSEFVVVCGKSGCGKSTLLRQLKKNLVPYGEKDGGACYEGIDITELEDRVNASEIGFVQQNPDNQIVTDKVWHELAFGLESLGLDNASIKRRVAEMASFFDIQTWFRKDVSELSGGQKQLLNLASIMVMQPKVLILDEPTSQLDPIAASEFLKVIYRINRELGTTVIISEHRLEELFTMADRVMVMDDGRILTMDTPWEVGDYLAGNSPESRHPMFYGLPAVMKIYYQCKTAGVPGFIKDGKEIAPLTIRDGRLWLEEILGERSFDLSKAAGIQNAQNETDEERNNKKEGIITAKDLWFRYDRNAQDVLRGLNLQAKEAELFCLLGGNGVGKTTTLKALSGQIFPQSGSITIDGKKVRKNNLKELFHGTLAMVPQNPQALFTELSAEEELLEAVYYLEMPDEVKAEKIENMLSIMEIEHLRKTHPYDLSGGEQQRLALGKILLLEPKILLLDEPTKGLDPFFKITLAGVFKKLTQAGVTIFMVSHDVEFCAEYGDRCAMAFDGDVVSVGTPTEFFAGNNFYTTAANRIARRWFPKAVTWEEVAKWVEWAMTTNS